MEASEARSTNGGGSLAHRAWVEADRAHARMDGHERLCAERHETIRRDLGDVKTGLDELETKVDNQSMLTRAAVDALRSDVSSKFAAVYNRMWWIVGLMISAQAAAIGLLVTIALKLGG